MAMTTPLAAFMDANGLTDEKLARLVGRERSTITKLRLGQARPSLDLAIKIAGLSEGAVPPTAYPEPRRPSRGVAA
jgi:transcriptional regulator with XRE-family HTH domain